jgi:hypothetical protein
MSKTRLASRKQDSAKQNFKQHVLDFHAQK